MDALELRIPSLAEQGPPHSQLAELLQGWLTHTDLADRVSELEVRQDGEEAVATLARGDRRVELRLHHAAPRTDRWMLDAVTWLVPAEPSRGWSALAGFAVFAAGFAVSAGYLAWSDWSFWVGVAVSLVLGLAVGRVTVRHASSGRMSLTEDHTGPAETVLRRLEGVIREDERVATVEPR